MISKKPADPEALLKRMASLCAKSEQCTYDISTKLYKAGLSSDGREKIIRYLTDNRFLDDSRYARAFVGDKVRFSHWGRRKIAMALRAKRIDSATISEALETIDPEEYMDILRKVAETKKRDMDLTDSQQRAKLYRSLLARGFESSLISSIL